VRDVVAGEEGRIGEFGFGSEVIDRRDARFVSTVEFIENLLGERLLNVAEHVGDRFLCRSAVLDGHGTLKNRDSLRILIEDGFDIF